MRVRTAIQHRNHPPWRPNTIWLLLTTYPTVQLMSSHDIQKLTERLREFASDRDWEQFHSPKNLAMALSVEVAEIVEHFQWLTEQQSRELDAAKMAQVKQELADAFIYLVRLSDQLKIDLFEAADQKLAINESRYPADQVRGSAKKYSEYD